MNSKSGQWRTTAAAHFSRIDPVIADGVPLFDIEVVRRATWRRWEVRLYISKRQWIVARCWSRQRALYKAAIETDIALDWLDQQGWL